MSQKYILPHLPNAIFPPDKHALYKDNLATGNAFSPPEAALFLVLTKGSAALGDEKWRTRMPKVIADIAQHNGNVLFLFH